jgi:hypothetical protein
MLGSNGKEYEEGSEWKNDFCLKKDLNYEPYC